MAIHTAQLPIYVDPQALADLMVEACDGAPGAFDKLVRTCAPLVRNEARKCQVRHVDIDDVEQEVLERLVRNLNQVRDPRALISWLVVVTRRVVIGAKRREGRDVTTPWIREPAGSDDTETEALAGSTQASEVAAVRLALADLSPESRALILALQGDKPMSYEAASKAMNRPIGSLGPTRRRVLRNLACHPAILSLQREVCAV
jgi:RNA polymerase sigma factor (sigma-70 family)